MGPVHPPNPAADAELLNALIRLMTPFRRLFQQPLDVNRFLVDRAYAQDIVDRLLSADDPRILGLAEFLRGRLLGDLTAQPVTKSVIDPEASLATPVTPAHLSSTGAVAPSIESRGQQLAKYVKRLR